MKDRGYVVLGIKDTKGNTHYITDARKNSDTDLVEVFTTREVQDALCLNIEDFEYVNELAYTENSHKWRFFNEFQEWGEAFVDEDTYNVRFDNHWFTVYKADKKVTVLGIYE